MTRSPLIGIGGWKTSGKDRLADFLVEDHGYGKTFMSEPLLEAVLALHPDGGPWVRLDRDVTAPPLRAVTWNKDEFVRFGELVEKVGYTATKEHADARLYLQGLGTEVGRRMFGEDVWTDIARRKLEALHAKGHAVITGLRYPNELDMVKSLGGVTVWVARPGLDAPNDTHTSETSLSMMDFDILVDNDGTLRDLRREAGLLHSFLATS
ncbi:deoxynucleoside monophosphate kinase [Microbacterium phage Magritte]|nr:deoxynucleoside monophosphate kinase [Microbacterium phage Magritte]